MTPEIFDQTTRKFVKREPFTPFVVELQDGRTIEISQPHVSFGGGAAGFLSDQQGLIGFLWKELRSIRPAGHEALP